MNEIALEVELMLDGKLDTTDGCHPDLDTFDTEVFGNRRFLAKTFGDRFCVDVSPGDIDFDSRLCS